MKHYVVILNWARDYEGATDVLGVTHTLQEAQAIFNEQLVQERQFAEQNGYDIDTDTDTMFDAGEMGYWCRDHITLYIQEVE